MKHRHVLRERGEFIRANLVFFRNLSTNIATQLGLASNSEASVKQFPMILKQRFFPRDFIAPLSSIVSLAAIAPLSSIVSLAVIPPSHIFWTWGTPWHRCRTDLYTFGFPLVPVTLTLTSVYSRCCERICSAMVGVPHRPLLSSLPTTHCDRHDRPRDIQYFQVLHLKAFEMSPFRSAAANAKA